MSFPSLGNNKERKTSTTKIKLIENDIDSRREHRKT